MRWNLLQKKGWLIYTKKDAQRNKSYIEWFQKEAKLQNLSLPLVLREDLTVGIDEHQTMIKHQSLSLPDFVVMRTIEPILSEIFEQKGIRVFNSATISYLCNDKRNTYRAMNKLNIPMVSTFFTHQRNLTTNPPLAFPFIIKNAYGRGGNHVYMVESKKDWVHTYKKLEELPLILQTCQVQLGVDIRVFVIGKQIIGAVKRENTKDFRANINQGGIATWYALNEKEKSLINQIINAYDFDLVGIDFLLDPKGNLLFNEIEDVVGSRTLSMTSDLNLLKKYVTHIREHFS